MRETFEQVALPLEAEMARIKEEVQAADATYFEK